MYTLKIVFETQIAEILETWCSPERLEMPVADVKETWTHSQKPFLTTSFVWKEPALRDEKREQLGQTSRASRLKVKITSKPYIDSK